jgi:hypothetical protein
MDGALKVNLKHSLFYEVVLTYSHMMQSCSVGSDDSMNILVATISNLDQSQVEAEGNRSTK